MYLSLIVFVAKILFFSFLLPLIVINKGIGNFFVRSYTNTYESPAQKSADLRLRFMRAATIRRDFRLNAPFCTTTLKTPFTQSNNPIKNAPVQTEIDLISILMY